MTINLWVTKKLYVALSYMSEITCPNCKSKNCLYGRLEPSDSDNQFRGEFYPLYIQQKTFFTVGEPKVKLNPDQKFKACYACGHLWGEVNLFNYKKVIDKEGWEDGGVQIEPKPQKSYFWLVSWIVFLSFGLAIAFFKYGPV